MPAACFSMRRSCFSGRGSSFFGRPRFLAGAGVSPCCGRSGFSRLSMAVESRAICPTSRSPWVCRTSASCSRVGSSLAANSAKARENVASLGTCDRFAQPGATLVVACRGGAASCPPAPARSASRSSAGSARPWPQTPAPAPPAPIPGAQVPRASAEAAFLVGASPEPQQVAAARASEARMPLPETGKVPLEISASSLIVSHGAACWSFRLVVVFCNFNIPKNPPACRNFSKKSPGNWIIQSACWVLQVARWIENEIPGPVAQRVIVPAGTFDDANRPERSGSLGNIGSERHATACTCSKQGRQAPGSEIVSHHLHHTTVFLRDRTHPGVTPYFSFIKN